MPIHRQRVVKCPSNEIEHTVKKQYLYARKLYINLIMAEHASLTVKESYSFGKCIKMSFLNVFRKFSQTCPCEHLYEAIQLY